MSNHGGRQLSDVRSTIEILPEVVKAVQGKAKIYVDCGIRYGSDVFKCLALGKYLNLILKQELILYLLEDQQFGPTLVLAKKGSRRC